MQLHEAVRKVSGQEREDFKQFLMSHYKLSSVLADRVLSQVVNIDKYKFGNSFYASDELDFLINQVKNQQSQNESLKQVQEKEKVQVKVKTNVELMQYINKSLLKRVNSQKHKTISLDIARNMNMKDKKFLMSVLYCSNIVKQQSLIKLKLEINSKHVYYALDLFEFKKLTNITDYNYIENKLKSLATVHDKFIYKNQKNKHFKKKCLVFSLLEEKKQKHIHVDETVMKAIQSIKHEAIANIVIYMISNVRRFGKNVDLSHVITYDKLFMKMCVVDRRQKHSIKKLLEKYKTLLLEIGITVKEKVLEYKQNPALIVVY